MRYAAILGKIDMALVFEQEMERGKFRDNAVVVKCEGLWLQAQLLGGKPQLWFENNPAEK